MNWQIVGSTISSMTGEKSIGLYSITGYTDPDNCLGNTQEIVSDFDYFKVFYTEKFQLPIDHEEGDNGFSHIRSFYDHKYPIYDAEPLTTADTIKIFTGETFPGTVGSCTAKGMRCYSGHNGIDFAKNLKDYSVHAAAAGNLTYTYESCLGNVIRINHGLYQTVYAHLESDEFLLKTDQFVNSWDRIGTIGNTGNSNCTTGPHLHFSVYFDQDADGSFAPDDVVDPYGWHDQCSYFGSDPWTITFSDKYNIQHTGATSNWLWEFSEPTCEILNQTNALELLTNDNITISIPAGAVVEPSIISYMISPEPSFDSGKLLKISSESLDNAIPIGHTFLISVTNQEGNQTKNLLAPLDIRISNINPTTTLFYPDTISLYWFDAQILDWVQIPTALNLSAGTAMGSSNKTGLFSLRAQPSNPPPIVDEVVQNQEKNIIIYGNNFLPEITGNLGIGSIYLEYISSEELRSNIPDSIPSGHYDLLLRNPDGQEFIYIEAVLINYHINFPLIVR